MSSYYAHHLGKAVRKRIIQELIAEYGNRRLAGMLGISPAAISKYASGIMHPSDSTMGKALKLAQGPLREKIAKLIVRDLSSALSEALQEYGEYIDWEDELDDLFLKLYLLRKTNPTRWKELAISRVSPS
ncbi:MAG: helix-turn-helix domain-containing protein [Desulfurococcales archaeon]|nr:helix-turn-helix domain-containing protein [Desulfurococcales archaeon]